MAKIMKNSHLPIREPMPQGSQEIQGIMEYLKDFKIGKRRATSILEVYGKNWKESIKANPYSLIDNIQGIGFKIADEIAMKLLGIAKGDSQRCRHGVLFKISEAANYGHVYVDYDRLLSDTSKLLGIQEPVVCQTIDEMNKNEDLIIEDRAVYLPCYYYAEVEIAKRIHSLEKRRSLLERADVDKILSQGNIQYDELQKGAVKSALQNNLLVITGGPGTGKTTVTAGIISVFKELKKRILLAAPTGRAAQKLEEATGMSAMTIHMLLEYRSDGKFARDENNPLEGDVLIVDESSMIDIFLMHSLLKAIANGMRLILVGDVDQLPSVGAGNVLRDIIDSGKVYVNRLSTIYRQTQLSSIIENAHLVNNGKMPNLNNNWNQDFMFIEKDDSSKALEEVISLVTKQIPDILRFNKNEIQVLSPMKKGNVGVIDLNKELQKAINPNGIYLPSNGYEFRKGDRVMQTKNNYEKDVYNGDIGIVESIDLASRSVKVDFGGRIIEYDDLDELTMAYAMTIHKSQGSEYPIVVITLMPEHSTMLQRNLVYTAMTRAKKLCVIVGSRKALQQAVLNTNAQKRNSRLKDRLLSN